MVKLVSRIGLISLFLLPLTMSLTACEKQGKMEEMGEKADDMLEKAGNEIENLSDELKKKAKDAKEKLHD